MTILERYKWLKNNNPENTEDKIILDCFKYGIFKTRPSKDFKETFEDAYEFKYPINFSDMSKKDLKEIKEGIALNKKHEKFEQKMSEQRKDRGYADVDVWNFNTWFSNITSKMIKQLVDNHVGHPVIDENGNHIKEFKTVNYDEDIANKKWEEILNRISFLASELNEETCSWHEKQEIVTNKWFELEEQFRNEYGNGDALKTEAEKKEEKEYHVFIHVSPERHPDKGFVKKYKSAVNEMRKFEKELFKYQNKCKNELFDLLKKYYWDLWD